MKKASKLLPLQATTLHMAAAGGHTNIVKILLENGANAEDENAVGFSYNGFSYLTMACPNFSME